MHPTTRAIFDEHANPTHCSKQDVHGLAEPILNMGIQAQAQVVRYRQLLIAAKLAPHDHALDGKLERIKQTLSAIDKTMPDFLDAGERLADAFTQLERVLTEAHVDIMRYEAAQGSGA